MSGIFKPVPARPVICAPALYAGNFARPALQSIALLLMIVIAMMAMVNPAQASNAPVKYQTSSTGTRVFSTISTACYEAWIATGGDTGAYRCPGLSSPSGYCWTLRYSSPADTSCFANCVDNGKGQLCPAPVGIFSQVIFICDAGYKLDPAGTSCVLEQYTISLHGLGGVVMPTQTRAAYAQVNTSTGSPKSGIPVNLALTVIEEPDGYNHAVGQHTAPHKGSLLLLAGATGADGRQPFEFVAPVAGGVHTITASCDKCVNQAIDTIRVPGCPVRELTEIDKLSELAGETQEQANLTKQLDEGKDGYSFLSKATQAAEQCLAKRVTEVVGTNSGYKVTSTIRTFAYQQHLWEIWDKFWDLRGRVTEDPSIQERCRTLITKVEGEMGLRLIQDPTNEKDECSTALGRAHCVRYPPATDDPKHVQNIAFDIPPKTVRTFERSLNRPPPSTVQKEANACGLTWGGTFGSPDRVHFQMQ